MPLHHKPVSANSYISPCMGLHRLNYENPSGYNLMSMWPGQAARRAEELRPGGTKLLHNRFGLNKSGAQRSSSAPPPRQQPSACRLSIAAMSRAAGRSRERHGAAESSSCQPQKRISRNPGLPVHKKIAQSHGVFEASLVLGCRRTGRSASNAWRTSSVTPPP